MLFKSVSVAHSSLDRLMSISGPTGPALPEEVTWTMLARA